MPVVTTINRLVYQNGKKTVSVAPKTTLELTDDQVAYFKGFNAVRDATDTETALFEKQSTPAKSAAAKKAAADKAAAAEKEQQAAEDAKKAADEKAAADAAQKQAEANPLA